MDGDVAAHFRFDHEKAWSAQDQPQDSAQAAVSPAQSHFPQPFLDPPLSSPPQALAKLLEVDSAQLAAQLASIDVCELLELDPSLLDVGCTFNARFIQRGACRLTLPPISHPIPGARASGFAERY